MKASGLAFGLLSVVFYLLWTPSSGLKILHLGSCVIVTNLQEIQSEFSEIRDSVVCAGSTISSPFLVCLSFPGNPVDVIMQNGRVGTH